MENIFKYCSELSFSHLLARTEIIPLIIIPIVLLHVYCGNYVFLGGKSRFLGQKHGGQKFL